MASYSNTCAICLEDILKTDTKVITLDCKHPFHTPCLSQLRTNKCPACRRRFTNIYPEILSKIKQREHNDMLSRNAEDFNELLPNFISDSELQSFLPQSFRRPLLRGGWRDSVPGLQSPSPPPTPVFIEFDDPEAFGDSPEIPAFPLAFITISLIRAIPPRFPISLLLNTQFQGVTIQTMLEDYIVRHFTA